MHIDCTWIPLKPGLVLSNPDRPIYEPDYKIWKENDWKIVHAPLPTTEERPLYSQATKWLAMNILSISENDILVESQETNLQQFLYDLGFNIIPIPFRNVYEFGGSLHCATWDILREDDCVDLFPKQ